MATRLTLVCHAPLAGRRAVAFPLDEPADQTELADVSALVAALGQFSELRTAPELRARQTANALGPGAIVTPVLRDCDYGSWCGRSLADIGERDPPGAEAWLLDPAAAPHGGESIVDLARRVGVWLDPCDETRHIVAVTHPAVIRAAIVHCLGAPPQAFWRIDIEPLSMTDLRRNAGRWTLRSVGRVDR